MTSRWLKMKGLYYDDIFYIQSEKAGHGGGSTSLIG